MWSVNWLDSDCWIPDWCGGADFDWSSTVDSDDLELFIGNWLYENYWWLEPIAHWKFDEGQGDIAYDSVGNNDGVINGAVWTTGKIGGALQFDGSDDYVETTTIDEIDQPISISAWFKTYAIGETQTIFGRNQGNSTIGYSYENCIRISQDGFVYFGDRPAGGGVDYLMATEPSEADQWYHIVVARDANSFAKLYVNGIFDNNDTVYDIDLDTVKYRIGIVNTGHYPFDGIIDDVRIYDRVLTDEEVWQLYEVGLSYKASNPNPADGAELVDPDTVLSWTPGKDASLHHVYFGTDFDDVNDATPASDEYQDSFSNSTWDPCGLNLETTYYWRIDEVADSNTYKGDVWSFTTIGNINNYLVSWWKFDEGEGDVAYDSIGNNHGNIYGATWTAGIIDGALDFDGLNDYVQTSPSADFVLLGDVSASMWIKWQTENKSFLGIEGGPGETEQENAVFFLHLYPPGVVQYIHEYGSGLNEEHLFPSVPYDTWVHIIVVRDSNLKTVKAYYNGLVQDSFIYINQPTNPQNSIATAIGARNGGDKAFDGVIDDVRIYDRALTDEEVWLLYIEVLKASDPSPVNGAELVDPNVILSWTPGKDASLHDVYFGTDFNDVNNATPDSNEYKGSFSDSTWDPCGLNLETTYYWRIDEIADSNIYKGDVWSFTTMGDINPMSWWKFDEGEGDTAYDSAGDNHGIIYGATWTTGELGSALEFDGADDYVETTTLDDIDQPISISAWFKTYAIGETQTIFGRNQGNSTVGYSYENCIRISQGGFVYFGDRPAGGGVDYLMATTPSEANQWYHIVITRDSNGYSSLYIDGDLDNSETVYDIDLDTVNYRIGRVNTGHYTFDGIIDDVRIYNQVLTGTEVLQVYQQGLGE